MKTSGFFGTLIRALPGLMILALPLFSCAQQEQTDRTPIFAGSFYSGTPEGLNAQLDALFSGAEPASLEGRPRCLIVPHAGYNYSGHVSASGYKSIPADTHYENIFIIAVSHREYFEGTSVYAVGDYLTPLGRVRVNKDIAETLMEENRSITFRPEAHDREHSIEVQIPMIQHLFGPGNTPPIVPLVIGSSSVATARDLATALMPWFTPENLFIISSDFSHYPAYQDAVRIDHITGDAILKNDPREFYKALRTASSEPVPNLATPCCSWSGVLTLLYMSEHVTDMKMTPVLYGNSGDSDPSTRDRVVGYWAIAGTSGEQVLSTLSPEEKETLLTISRQTLEMYVRNQKIPHMEESNLPEVLRQPAGAFVTLYKYGELRGCIGNFFPDQPLYRVIQDMTVAAATRDPRFYPVREGELEFLNIEISVLTPMRKINSVDEFELGRHGIYMFKEGKSGTFLPQVAQSTGWNREEFLEHCAADKAGIGPDGWKTADLYVYEAIVFGEEKKK
jgi:AmmeMemoRadiSam system protein B/AmmeMemoRadiSam system protein A